ncbi:MAG: hypothetical protein KJ638_00370 [Chloroflexi bacterium]|nr:hypothetical protein [Chloroflexota bacterium]
MTRKWSVLMFHEYTKSEVIHEAELETRAGSPLSIPGDMLDWLLLDE